MPVATETREGLYVRETSAHREFKFTGSGMDDVSVGVQADMAEIARIDLFRPLTQGRSVKGPGSILFGENAAASSATILGAAALEIELGIAEPPPDLSQLLAAAVATRRRAPADDIDAWARKLASDAAIE